MEDMPNEEESWKIWSKHVLKELERLNEGQDQIKNDIQDLKNNLTRVAVIEDQIQDIKAWKSSMMEIYSPTQLAEEKKEIESLKAFKIRFATVWLIVQFVITVALALLG